MNQSKPIERNYLIILYLMIIILPLLLNIQHPAFILLEQPLLILLPTLLISWHYLQQKKGNFTSFLALKPISIPHIGLLTLLAILLPFVIFAIADFSAIFIGDTEVDDAFLPTEGQQTIWIALGILLYNILYSAIFPGICEEALFRGSLLSWSKKILHHPWQIIVLNAFLFAFFHMNLMQFLYTFALGLVLTTLVWVGKSLLSAIYVHTLYNIIADLPSLIDIDKHPWIDQYFTWVTEENNLIFWLLACAMVYWILKTIATQQAMRHQ